MRILITGVGGFVGQHLADHLRTTQPTIDLHGTVFTAREHAPPGLTLHPVDLRDQAATAALIKALRPDQIYHLAAWARVRGSFESAWETLENNVRAQLNVILGCLDAGILPRMLIVSSGEIYGGHQPLIAPMREDAPLCPGNPYSVSKATQDLLGLQYFLSHGFPIIRARPFNHLGSGQSTGFVAPDFALQIARIEAGLQPPVIRVGTLTAERDFTDVRDVVRAYALLMTHGTAGEAYNVASSVTHPIRFVLDTLLSYSTQRVTVETDTSLIKQGAPTRTAGDYTRLRTATGWMPRIPLTETLAVVLEDCRARIRAELAENSDSPSAR